MQWRPSFVECARALKSLRFEVSSLSECLFYQREPCCNRARAHAAAMQGRPARLIGCNGMLYIYYVVTDDYFE